MIEYIILRRKIKNVYICIKDGQVVVKAPLKLSEEKIKELINEKSAWIEKKLKNKKEDRNIDIKNKDYIYILGNKIKMEYEYISKNKINIFLDENSCKISIPLNTKLTDEMYLKIEEKLDKELRKIAEKYILIAIEKYINLTCLCPEKITIRKFKTIWGNCSSKREIKINQRIIHYGMEQIEYVCLHEITHLKYMNHQKSFWSFVAKYMPNYKEISNVLKQ